MTRAEGLLVQTIVNAGWQLTLVAIVAAGGLRLLRRSTVQIQYRCAVASLLAAAVVPLVSFACNAFRRGGPASLDTDNAVWAFGQSLDGGHAVTLSDSAGVWILGLSIVMAAIHLLRLARSGLYGTAIRRRAEATPVRWQSEARAACARFRVEPVPVLQSAFIGTPMLVGWRTPAIVIPSGLIDSDPETVRSIVGHELAHLVRRDLLWNLLLRLAVTPVAFHPALPWLRRQVDQTRELACDACAIDTLAVPPDGYARALVRVAAGEMAKTRGFALRFGSRQALERRLNHILMPGPAAPRGLGTVIFAATLVGVALAALGGRALVFRSSNHAAMTGSWRLTPASAAARSLAGARLTIAADWNVLHLAQTRTTAAGATESFRLAAPIDGRPVDLRLPNGQRALARASWHGGRLILDVQLPDAAGLEHDEVYRRDGQLVITSDTRLNDMRRRQELVFDRSEGDRR